MRVVLILFALLLPAAFCIDKAAQYDALSQWRQTIKFLNPDGSVNTAPWTSADPCAAAPAKWAGISCDANGNVLTITVAPGIQGGLMVGAFPPVDEWDYSGAFYDELNNIGLSSITFENVRLGPFLPAWVERYWIGQSVHPLIEVEIKKTLSPVICDPSFQPLSADTWCTTLNIVSRTPGYGPAAGGNPVTIQLSGFADYDEIYCSFSTIEEDLNPDYKVLPVAASTKDMDYSWSSLDYPRAIVYSVAACPVDYPSCDVPMWRTNFTCIAPPHPPGEVQLTLKWKVGGSFLLITDKSLPYYYECPPGYYNSNPAATTPDCRICPAGTFSGFNATACSNCPAGTWNDKPGASVCKNCLAGTFYNSTGAKNITSCELCPLGFYSNAGAGYCPPCPAGTFVESAGAAQCPSCPIGTFSDSPGSPNCTKCPAGSFQPFIGSTSCLYCPPASYANLTGLSVCTPCPPGATTNGSGATYCDTKCPAGTYRPSSVSRCIPCAPGRYGNNTGLALCSLCPVGFYQSDTGSSECIKCPEGSVTVRGGQSICQRVVRIQQPAESNGLIIGLVFIVLGVILVAIAIVYIVYKKKQQKKMKEEIELLKTEIGRLEKSKGGGGDATGYSSSDE